MKPGSTQSDASGPSQSNANGSLASATPSLSSPRQLLIFAVALPAVVAATNQLMIKALPADWLRTWLYPAMAVSTAVLSWCAGRYLQPAWLSWLVFGWGLALLDLLTIAVCLSGPIENHFGVIMVTAQMCLVVLWAILGTSKWQWRMPIVLIATPFIIVYAGLLMRNAYGGWHGPNWAILMIMTTVVVAILCGSLRMAGFSLLLPHASINSQLGEQDRVFQFGLRHMLIWSAALVPLLLVGRGLDFLVVGRIGAQGTFPLMLVASSLAILSLTAIWAALGKGPWVARIAALIIVPIVFAYALRQMTIYLESTLGGWPYKSMAFVLYTLKESWTSWLMMSAMVLAALLLFLRARGYRLMRRQPPT
jgi:hypothetical protein